MQHIEEAVQDAIDGNRDPVQVYLILRDMQDLIKTQIERLNDEVLAELDRYPKQIMTLDNWEVSAVERKIYDWKEVTVIQDIEGKIANIKKVLKYGDYLDPETGEITPQAPYKVNTSIKRAKARS